MYAIISKGELLALCERPRYVKRNEETGAYVEAAEAEAIGIAVGGEVYNLPGGTAIPDAPEALAQEGEAEEYVFRNHARIIRFCQIGLRIALLQGGQRRLRRRGGSHVRAGQLLGGAADGGGRSSLRAGQRCKRRR